ncbi:hypothetical protein CS063_17120 [Sporanaerobium hydrogeniformans]|uniref:Uncharacterized protein n=1 Tax=Sporanaerobium hydrogeniformans TaxID=3072179 RepID=A0AC61D8X9_9FIRM|nr:PAS domain-containing sensor histidine kinase [Sporanaerobium hydrogeniformans]PHV69208.1 hypothetical protein CS063_17120 [Sporanaerobium hydrogeniformans]
MDKGYTLSDLEQVLDKLPFLVWINDEKGSIIYGNNNYHTQWATLNSTNKDRETNGRPCYQSVQIPRYDSEGKQKGNYNLAKDITTDTFLLDYFIESYKLIERLTIPGKIQLDLNEGLSEVKSLLDEILAQSKGDVIAVFLNQEEEMELQLQFLVSVNEGMLCDLEKKFIPLKKNDLLEQERYYGHFLKINELKGILEELVNGLQMKGLRIYPILIGRSFIGFITIFYNKPFDRMKGLDLGIRGNIYYLGLVIKYIKVYKQAQKVIAKRFEGEKELEFLLNHIEQLVIIMNEDGKIMNIGSEWEELLGWRMEQLAERPLEDLIHPESRLRFKQACSRLMTDKSLHYIEQEVSLKNHLGSYEEMICYMKYIPSMQQFMIRGRNLSEIKKMRKEYVHLQRDIAFERVKGDFLTYTTQELKKPIGVLLENVEVIESFLKEYQEMENKEGWQRYIGMLRQNGNRLERLVSNLVDNNKIERGAFELQLEYYDIVQLMEHMVASIRNYVEDKGLELCLDKPTTRVIIFCDAKQIQRIFLNLISNAIKYTERGGSIHIKLNKQEEEIFIEVADTGEGIPKEKLDKIFESFVRGYNSLTRRKEGSGVGLALVKGLVTLHRGEIRVVSELEQGTCFYIKLPCIGEGWISTKEIKQISETDIKGWEKEFADI